MVITGPQFLSIEELIDLQKDACLFCDSRFRTRSRSKTEEVWASGCYADYKYKVTTTTHYVADLDLYSFTLKLESEKQSELHQKYRQLHDELKEKIQKEAPRVKEELQMHPWKLPERWEGKENIVIEAIMEHYWSEIRDSSGFGETPLQRRLEKLFHNLQLGDLQLAESYRHFEDRSLSTVYFPHGLKSHHRCWPYEAVTERTQKEMPLGELADLVIAKNKRFADYEKLFAEFPGLWKEVRQMPMTMHINPYNPLDGVIRQ